MERYRAPLPEWFRELDADDDGRVSIFEWPEGVWALEDFLKEDLNGDGFITREEVLRMAP